MNHTRTVALLAASAVASMISIATADAQAVYLKLRVNGAELKGNVTQKGREGSIKCEIVEMSVKAPRDAASGMATGRRQYDGISCTKPIDKSSPLLVKALAENEAIDGSFDFWEPQLRAATGTGSEVQFYTIDIKQARVAEIRQFVNAIDPAEVRKGALERVTFAFQSITFTIKDGGITFSDAMKDNR